MNTLLKLQGSIPPDWRSTSGGLLGSRRLIWSGVLLYLCVLEPFGFYRL